VESLWQDMRYAVRTLRRTPLFAITIAATMGLGLGLLGSAFTILNAYLLKPIDLPDPHALYSLSWDTDTTRRQRFTLADYEALQPEVRRLAGVAAAQDVTVMEDAVSTPGLLVTGNYFELLGARPALGRLLRPDDAALAAATWRGSHTRRGGAGVGDRGPTIPLGRQRFRRWSEPHANRGRKA
jgi:hypothetical protein